MRRVEGCAGLHFSPRRLPHCRIVGLISAGVPVPQVAQHVGHAGSQVTMRVYAYAMHFDAVRVREAVAEMAAASE